MTMMLMMMMIMMITAMIVVERKISKALLYFFFFSFFFSSSSHWFIAIHFLIFSSISTRFLSQFKNTIFWIVSTRMFCQFQKTSSSKFTTLSLNQFASSISTSSSNQFENSNFKISNSSFIFFDENNIISLRKRSTKQITFTTAIKSNFEFLKTTSSLSFFKSKFEHNSQRFCDSHSLSIQRHTHTTQHSLIDVSSLLFNNFLFLVDDHLTIIASWSSMKKNNVR
jgi:hypothetical protein